MISYILGAIFSILGIIGYYTNCYILLILSIVAIVAEAVIEIKKGALQTISTYVLACIIGIIVALIFHLSILSTIAVALCYEELLMALMSVGYMINSYNRFCGKSRKE